MRIHVLIVAVVSISSVASAQKTLGVVLSVEQQGYSREAMKAMQLEAATILRDSGLELEWALQENLAGHREFAELVVFRMKGRCAMDSFPLPPDELGLPLARTHASDGETLSFGEVDCDRVRHSVKKSLLPSDYRRGNVVLGRALGRVLAHETYHILTRSAVHADQGVAKERLSSRELTAERLRLSEKSLAAIREQMALMKKAQSNPGETLPSNYTLP